MEDGSDLVSSLIHTFAQPDPSPITSIVQSPAIDVVGVGYLDGTIRILDIRNGDLILRVKMEDGGVTSLAFRMGKSCKSFVTHVRRASGPRFIVFNRIDSHLGSQQRWSCTSCSSWST